MESIILLALAPEELPVYRKIISVLGSVGASFLKAISLTAQFTTKVLSRVLLINGSEV